MPNEWYFAKGEVKLGPFSWEQLKQLAAAGQILPSDTVWQEGWQVWIAATKVSDLCPAQIDAGGDKTSPAKTPVENTAATNRYWLLVDTTPTGPFDIPTIQSKLASREITLETLAAPLGSHSWRPLQDHSPAFVQNDASTPQPQSVSGAAGGNMTPSLAHEKPKDQDSLRDAKPQTNSTANTISTAPTPGLIHLVQASGGLVVGPVLLLTPFREWGLIITGLSSIYFFYGLAKYSRHVAKCVPKSDTTVAKLPTVNPVGSPRFQYFLIGVGSKLAAPMGLFIVALSLGTLLTMAFWLHSEGQRLPADLVKDWEVAGARTGWMWTNEDGVLVFRVGREATVGGVPAFEFVKWQAGELKHLPKPEQAFGLNLRGIKVQDAELKELVALKQLRALDLSDNSVTDEGLKSLAKIKQLKWLSLARNRRLTDAGLNRLAKLAQLQSLDLGGTWLTDVGLEELVVLKQLKKLGLHSAYVTDAGVAELQDALPMCRISHRYR